MNTITGQRYVIYESTKTDSSSQKDIRCFFCCKRLFDLVKEGTAIIELKCPNCGKINTIDFESLKI
ncbi:Com family DNA-binding transcriptional regulator [bacterium]|nr:Com family DNA-binding transcriptional regulator [bacterium]